MKLTIFEEAEDLGAIILGIQKDASRESFNQIVEILKENNIEVERFDTIHHKDQLQDKNNLPVFEIDNVLIFDGGYPSKIDVASWFGLNLELFESVTTQNQILKEANDGRIGYCCGVGTDIYIDPNEEDEK